MDSTRFSYWRRASPCSEASSDITAVESLSTRNVLTSLIPRIIRVQAAKMTPIKRMSSLRSREPAATGSFTPLKASMEQFDYNRERESDSEIDLLDDSKTSSPLGTPFGSPSRSHSSSRPLSSRSTLPVWPTAEVESGIKWRYANQGYELLTKAIAESETLETDLSRDRGGVLCRDLYISAMVYGLRGLPEDLTEAEMMGLRAAVQESLGEHTIMLEDRDAQPVEETGRALFSTNGDVSILHHVVAYIVLHCFILLHFCLPYIKVFIAQAYAWERRHHLSERLLARSVDTVDGIGKTAMVLAERVCAADGGKVERSLNELAGWWVQGLGGGIREGVREAVILLRREREDEAEDEVES